MAKFLVMVIAMITRMTETVVVVVLKTTMTMMMMMMMMMIIIIVLYNLRSFPYLIFISLFHNLMYLYFIHLSYLFIYLFIYLFLSLRLV